MNEKRHIRLRVELKEPECQNQHLIQGLYPAYFPCQPYDQQLKIIKTVHEALSRRENALIDSPTGTGKTLSLLVGTLSFLSNCQHRQKILYLTRTHSQLNQVVAEMNKTCYRFRMCILASRQSSCINVELKGYRGRDLDRKCDRECLLGKCSFRNWKQDVELPILDLPRLRQFGRKQRFCPYYYSRKIQPSTEVVLMPYNYLMDLELLKNNKIELSDAIVVIDEAHNIDHQAQQGCSFSLTTKMLKEATRQLNTLKTEQPHIEAIKAVLRTMAANLSRCQEGVTHLDTFQDLITTIQNLTTDSTGDQTNKYVSGLTTKNIEQFFSVSRRICRQLSAQSKFNDCLQFFERCFISFKDQEQTNYSIYTQNSQNIKILNIYCLTSSVIFRRLLSLSPRSVILASGTLQPLCYWQQETAMSFPHQLQNESFISKQHVYASIISNFKGQQFDFSYTSRSSKAQLLNLISLISHVGRQTPNGIVVCFGSYEIYDKFLDVLGDTDLPKVAFRETRECNPENLISMYTKEASNNGAYLFTVMRGKFSEGIDFKDDLCRAMIVVGIPFPPQTVEVQDKQRYINNQKEQTVSARDWYIMEAIKAVNQAIGRVIRHNHDFGGVLLVDKRYSSRQTIRQMLPKWFKDNQVEYQSKGYQQFFHIHGKLKEDSSNLINSETVFNKPRRKLLFDESVTLKKSADRDMIPELLPVKPKITKLQ